METCAASGRPDGFAPGAARPTRVRAATLVGTAIEFHDFHVHGTATALMLTGAYFPWLDPA
ncbi:hypothetical protein ACGF0J_05055 [Nonomuraea sp. NPDC047897]|uniref:hypothetical protein n=1 Tax=Nonomuraea sp. NPDC047897 TaxID=3364346 RepID=UPI00371C9F7E